MSGGFSTAYRGAAWQTTQNTAHGYADASAPTHQDGYFYDPQVRAFTNCSANPNDFVNDAQTNFVQAASTTYGHPSAAAVAPSTPVVRNEQQQAFTQQQSSNSSVRAPVKFETVFQEPVPVLGWTLASEHKLQTYVQSHLSSGGECQVVGYAGSNDDSAPYLPNCNVATPPTASANPHGSTTPVFPWMLQRRSEPAEECSRHPAGKNHF
ncbi:hypothetical protein MRX96_054554 [Rhipicephalus microplus]